MGITIPRPPPMGGEVKMARNATKSKFRTSKMVDAAILSKFPKKLKLRIDLKWPEMRSKVNFGHPKWPTAAILSNISKQINVAYQSEMARMRSKVNFGTSKMSAGGHFVKTNQSH